MKLPVFASLIRNHVPTFSRRGCSLANRKLNYKEDWKRENIALSGHLSSILFPSIIAFQFLSSRQQMKLEWFSLTDFFQSPLSFRFLFWPAFFSFPASDVQRMDSAWRNWWDSYSVCFVHFGCAVVTVISETTVRWPVKTLIIWWIWSSNQVVNSGEKQANKHRV